MGRWDATCQARIEEYASRHKPVPVGTLNRGGCGTEIGMTAALGSTAPPTDLVYSVRCLAFRAGQLLVMRNRGGVHLLPGGRVEEGESLQQALRRELLEESGWTLDGIGQLGFVHLRFRTARPDDYSGPFPGFLWVIFRAEAKSRHPEAMLTGDNEEEAQFRPMEDVWQIPPSPAEAFFLVEAYRCRDGRLRS
jgi:ADP-ribose pyrophosphatase YjhB (NUDIX family)